MANILRVWVGTVIKYDGSSADNVNKSDRFLWSLGHIGEQMPSTDDGPPRFEQVDWSDIDTSRRLATTERLVALTGFALVGLLYVYDTYVGGYYLLGSWAVSWLDWLFMLAVVVLAAYGVVPALQHRSFCRLLATRLRRKPVTLLAGLYVGAFLLVAFVGPILVSRPQLQFNVAYQPPIGFATQEFGAECAGRTTGSVFEEVCHGSLEYPLGTNKRGIPLEYLLVSGARVALYIVVIAGAFVVPLAAVVGIVAGLRGGRLDDLLMAYVDMQLCLPAIILYFVGYMYWGPSLLLLLACFGLLSWGGIARLVRSEVLQRREDGHVVVARSIGASESYIAKRHILPNITNTLVPAVFHLLALFVFVEVGIAFLGFKDLNTYSWGLTIAGDLDHRIWWVSTFPALALTGTLLSFKLLGDGLRDALDPRSGGS